MAAVLVSFALAGAAGAFGQVESIVAGKERGERGLPASAAGQFIDSAEVRVAGHRDRGGSECRGAVFGDRGRTVVSIWRPSRGRVERVGWGTEFRSSRTKVESAEREENRRSPGQSALRPGSEVSVDDEIPCDHDRSPRGGRRAAKRSRPRSRPTRCGWSGPRRPWGCDPAAGSLRELLAEARTRMVGAGVIESAS